MLLPWFSFEMIVIWGNFRTIAAALWKYNSTAGNDRSRDSAVWMNCNLWLVIEHIENTLALYTDYLIQTQQLNFRGVAFWIKDQGFPKAL